MPGNAGKAKNRSLQEDKDNPCHNQGGCQQAGDAPPLQYVLACWRIVSRLQVLQNPQACCITPDQSLFLDPHVRPRIEDLRISNHRAADALPLGHCHSCRATPAQQGKLERRWTAGQHPRNSQQRRVHVHARPAVVKHTSCPCRPACA